MISPGNGIFRVSDKLAQITQQRMMDNGIGMDMISLSSPPLHSVPIFIHRRPFEVGVSGLVFVSVNARKLWCRQHATTHMRTQTAEQYEIPHWMNLSYLGGKSSVTSSSLVSMGNLIADPNLKPLFHSEPYPSP